MIVKELEIQKCGPARGATGKFNRLSLVYELCQCQTPQNAMCLYSCCSVDASVASRHLKILKQEGIVQLEKMVANRHTLLIEIMLASKLFLQIK